MMYDFGGALHLLKDGHYLSREGWNGKDMWIAMWYSDPAAGAMSLPFIYMKTVTGDTVPWLASQTDMLAEDWFVSPFNEDVTKPDYFVGANWDMNHPDAA